MTLSEKEAFKQLYNSINMNDGKKFHIHTSQKKLHEAFMTLEKEGFCSLIIDKQFNSTSIYFVHPKTNNYVF